MLMRESLILFAKAANFIMKLNDWSLVMELIVAFQWKY